MEQQKCGSPRVLEHPRACAGGYNTYTTAIRPHHSSEFTSGTNLGGSTRLDNLSGVSPARNIGVKATILKQYSSGSYSTFKASDYFYNDTESSALVTFVSDWSVPAGYYVGQGYSAIYYNGDYKIESTYRTPMIEVYK